MTTPDKLYWRYRVSPNLLEAASWTYAAIYNFIYPNLSTVIFYLSVDEKSVIK